MSLIQRIKLLVLSAVLLVAASLQTEAQTTTASLTGKVQDATGAPVPGATVIATHTPSGTVYGSTTNANGNYTILYMRTGGPYTVRVTFVGFKPSERAGLTLALSEQKVVDFTIAEENATIAVEVSAQADAVIQADRTGAKQNIGTAQIESMPTIARSIQDFTKLSPQVVGNSAGGANFRYNNIQIDGAAANDVFGLADSGTAGGLAGAQPIGLDAIAEFNVEIAPYDVRQSGFTGGLINAITRSGNNDFSGSAFFYGRNQNFTGKLTKDAGGNPLVNGSGVPTASYLSDFTDAQGGFRIGGPIVKNKLFFFVNGELRRRGDPTDAGLSDYNTTAANIFKTTKANMDRIISIAQTKYNYDAGSYDVFDATRNSDYVLARFDYNINNKHRLMLRHNYVDAQRVSGVDRRTTQFGLSSQAYDFLSTQNSTVLQLTSVLGARLGNEARLVYTTIRDKRAPRSNPFPQIEIQNVGGSGANVFLGVERSSQQNALDQNLTSFTDNFTYFMGNHNLTAGLQVEHSFFSNLFIQDAYGTWRFSSIDNFDNGIANRYRKSYLLNGGKERAEWSMLMSGLYVQDQWKIMPTLRMTFGFRVDMASFLDKPTENPTFAADFPGRSTAEVPSGQLLYSPRFGFNYDVFGNKKTQLRGGSGIFTGKTPGVWLSNQYSNTGVDFARIDVTSSGTIPTVNMDPNFTPSASIVTPTTAIALTDKGFKLPQNWRSNLALDQELPFGFIGTLEFLYTKTLNDIVYENLNLNTTEANVNKSIVPIDGRPLYIASRTFPSKYTSVVLLKNTNEGQTVNATVQIQKPERKGFYGNFAYTWGQAKDINSGRSAVALSQFEFNEVAGNPNNPGLALSDYDVRHRVLASMSYKFDLGRFVNVKNLGTTISAIYEGRSGTPYNFVYSGDANGDGYSSNDLVYVPKDGTDIILTTNNWADLDAFIKSIPELDANRGKIFPRNGARQPWRNNLDMRVTMDLPSVKNQRFQLTWDVLNFLSLLNEDWGVQKFVNLDSYYLLSLTGSGSAGYDPTTGKPKVRFTKPANGTPYDVDQIASRWQMQLGIRYTF